MVRCLIKSHHQEYEPSKWNDDAEGMCNSVASLEPDPRYDGCCSNIFRPGRVVRDLIVGGLVVLAIAVVVAVIFVVCFFFMPGSEGESALLGEESAFHGEPFSDEGGYKGINEVEFHNDTRYEVSPKLERIKEGKHDHKHEHKHDHEHHHEHDHADHDHTHPESEPEPEPETEPEPTPEEEPETEPEPEPESEPEPEPESEPEPEPEGDHSHDHAHPHDHEHAHTHDHTHDHAHNHEHPHTHDHAHEHPHDHAHDHEHPHTHDHDHEHPHTHDHDHPHPHEHGPVTHDHTHPEMDHDHTHPEMDHDHTHPVDHAADPETQQSEHPPVTSVHLDKDENLPPLFSLFSPRPDEGSEGTLRELDIPHEHMEETHGNTEVIPTEAEGVTEAVTEVPQGECRPRTLEMCGDLPHAMTAFPNWAGDQNEEEMHQTSLPFLRDVIVRSRCSPRAKEYSCAILEPPCDSNGNILPPCRTFCKSVAATCQEFITSRFSLSSAFDCEQFPDSTDPNVCFDMTQADSIPEDAENVTPAIEADTETTEPTLETTTAQEEAVTTTIPSCPELQCLDGSCITLAQVNDGVVDCPDGIDEENFGEI